MSLIRLNQLDDEIIDLVDKKDVNIKEQIETSMQYTVGPDAPESPSIGYRWFDTSTSLMKIWNGEGEGADWEITNSNAIYLPGKNVVESQSTAKKQITTGSGFLEFGGRIDSSKEVNKAMLANDGNPRLAGIVGEGEDGVKKFWFENFFLLNANGYDEENIDPSTGEISEILVDGINITLQGTKPKSDVITDSKLMAVNLPEAPNSEEEMHRNEMVFVEVWKEDITETGYVFPYGNVQYTGEAADGINTTYYDGEVSYCESFDGDSIVEEEVGEDGTVTTTTKPKGRGWVWKDLNASFKGRISSNFKHNLFVDGDKLIQIRYRVRVVNYSDKPAHGITNSTVLGFSKDNDAGSVIKAQGKMQSPDNSDDNYKILAPYNENNPHSLNGTYSTEYSNDLSQDGFVYALPISIVSRRNTGVFDTIFNPNGSARFRDGIRLVADYDDSDHIIGFALMDKENATLASSTKGTSWDDKYKIMIKWLFDRETVLKSYNNDKGFVVGGDMNSGISGRYDGLYYDEINQIDIKDLRIDVNKQLDTSYVLEKEFNKFILSEQRGWEREKHLYYWKGNAANTVKAEFLDSDGNRKPLMDGDKQVTGYGYTSEIAINYKKSDDTVIEGVDKYIANQISSGYTTTIFVRAGVPDSSESSRPFYENKFSQRVRVSLVPVLNSNGETQKDENNEIIKKIVIHDGEVYVDEDTEIIIVSPKGMTPRKTQLYADIVGDPKGNSFKFTTTEKVAELPNDAILENGNIVFTGQNYFVYRGSRKTKSVIEAEHMDTSGYFSIDETDTNTWINVTDNGGYAEGWKMYGNLGTPLLVGEEKNSLIPRDVTSGFFDENDQLKRKNTKFFKLSKPVKSIKKVIVTTDKKAGTKAFLEQKTASVVTDSGETKSILDQVDEVPATFAFDNSVYLTNNNLIAINWESFTDDAIIEIYYEVESDPTSLASNTKVEMLGDVWVGNSLYHDLGCVSISNLMNKVSTNDAPIGSTGAAKRIPLSAYLVNKGSDGSVLNSEWTVIKHDPVELGGTGPAIKMLPYLTSVRGEMFLQILYKELDQTELSNGTAYTYDNDEFVVVEGESLDDNGGTGNKVKVGQKRIRLPYYFGEVK